MSRDSLWLSSKSVPCEALTSQAGEDFHHALGQDEAFQGHRIPGLRQLCQGQPSFAIDAE